MPFDSVPTSSLQVVADLDRIAHRIRVPQLWCKGDYDRGCRRCLLGAAASLFNGETYRDTRRFLDIAANARGFAHAVAFNDFPKTKHPDVLALIEEAKAIALAEG